MGRCDVRRGAAVPLRGPVGAARQAAAGGAEHLPADAAARPQHGRLHAVPDRGHRGVRAGGGRAPASTCSGSSTRSTTWSRCGRRSRRSAPRARRSPRSRSATPATCPRRTRSSTRSTTTCGSPSGSSRPGRTCSRSRTWPGCCARPRPGCWCARCASASTCPCTCTPTTPRAVSSRRCSPPSTRGSTPSTRHRLDGRHHVAAGAVGARGDDRPHRAGDRARPRRGVRPRAVLGGRPPRLRAVRVRPRVADRPRLHPRDPRRPAVEPAAAGGVARARREVRADRGHVRRRQRHPRQHRQGHAVVEGGRRPRAAPRRGRRRPARVRGRAGQVRRTRLRHRLPLRRPRRASGWLAGAVPHQGARGPHRQAGRRRSSTRTSARACRRTGG